VNGLRDDNPVAGLNAYELRHLGEHLAEAGDAADLERLLALDWTVESVASPPPPKRRRRLPWKRQRRGDEDPSHTVIIYRNAWYEAKEGIGDPDGHRADIDRTWRMAIEACFDAVSRGERVPGDRELRCALLVASVTSIGSVLTGEFLKAMLAAGVWSEAHALSYAQQGDYGARQQKVATLLPALSSETRADVLPSLLADRREGDRPDVLASIAQFLDLEQIRGGLAELRTCKDSLRRSLAAGALAERLVDLGRVDEAFEVVTNEMPLRHVAAEALTTLAPRLSALQVRAGFDAAREWDSLEIASVGLCARLAAFGAAREALKLARGIDLPYQKGRLIAGIAPWLDHSMREEALELLRPISINDIKVKALLALAASATDDGDARAGAKMANEAVALISAASGRGRAETLAFVAADLCAMRPEPALALAAGIRDDGARVIALAKVAPYLPLALAGQARKQALSSVGGGGEFGGDVVIALAAVDAAAALGIARRHFEQTGRPRLFVELVPHLPADVLSTAGDLLGEARATLGRVGDSGECDSGRAALAAERAACGDPVGLDRLEAMERSEHRAALLADIAPRVPETLLGRTAELITALSGHDREAPVTAIAPRLSADQQRALLKAATRNEYDWAYAKVLEALAPYLNAEVVARALKLAVSRRDEVWRASALAAVAPRLDREQLEYIRAQALRLGDQGEVTSAVATRLAELGHTDEALALVTTAMASTWKAQVLCGIAPYVDGPHARARFETLASAFAPQPRADALAALAAHAEGSERARLRELAVASATEAAVEGGEHRVPAAFPRAMARISCRLGGEMLDRVLRAGEATDEYDRANLIAYLGPVGPSDCEAVAELARSIKDPGQRADAFVALVKAVVEPTSALIAEALRAVAATDAAISRRRHLRTVLDVLVRLDPNAAYEQWSSILPVLTARGREALMSDIDAMARIIGFLGGVDSLCAAEKAIGDVQRWWP
jgi:hypothetical protein